jgi:DNA-binding NtrC family response regulator
MQARESHAAPHPVILVVEDNQSFRKSMQQILEDADFLVIPAADADQALELAQSCSGPIDLLLTTLRPGGMRGPDLAYSLRKRSPGMSVLYSTANPMAALEIPDPAEVVSSMLPRPFSKTTLLRRINTLLAEHT